MHSRRFTLLAGTALIATGSVAGAEFKIGNHTFTLPDGFEIELAAGPPLVNRPIEADFDEHGRLYVTDSSGSNDPVKVQLEKKPHRIVRLEDTDRDGRFDRSTVFADQMMFPEGALWHDGSLYVSAPPSIWKLTDTDGDGVADQRVEWFQGKTLTGCANDLHGPYRGPDGWIYWCKGAFAEQTYTAPGRVPWVTRASHILRCRPDGSGLEPVMTGGMDNPVGIAFTPEGERIFTATFFQHPGGGRRDGLVHAIYGGVYGKDHNVLDGHPRTGDLMPVLSHLGPAAPCGLTRYSSTVFGEEYRDNLFATLFNLRKVTRHVLEPDGGTFQSHDSDFLVSDNQDFHPTDVFEDADGSLLVIDTGGWYKLCCPTSQLWKPDVLGTIYRIRRSGAPAMEDPHGSRLAWARMQPQELVQQLADPRPVVRQRAIDQLERHGEEAVQPLAHALSEGPDAVRRDAVWALTRIESPTARGAVRQALRDPNNSVRHAAVHSVSLRRDGGALPYLVELLGNRDRMLRRAAAEAIGRLGESSAVPAVLAAAGQKNDRALEHSLTYALIEIANPSGTMGGLDAQSSFEKRTALLALDQMEGGGLQPAAVIPLLSSSDPLLRQTALWIAERRPEWGDAIAGYLRQVLARPISDGAETGEVEGLLRRFCRVEAIQALIAETLRESAISDLTKRLVLRAMAGSGLKETPESWTTPLARLLAVGGPESARQAVATVRALPEPKAGAADLRAGLLRVARRSGTLAEDRLTALAAVPGGLEAADDESFAFLLEHVTPVNSVSRRADAVTVLAKANLSQEQRFELADWLRKVGPLELPKILSVFEKSPEEPLGLRVLSALDESTGLSGLRPETMKPFLAKFSPAVQEAGQALLNRINLDAAQQQARIDDLLRGMTAGDIRSGQAIFNSPRAACSSCHEIGYLGGNLGPDLTRIGQIRNERDLLEAIVYPSASFVRSYEPITVLTKEGDDFTGVLRSEGPSVVVLGTGPGVEIQIARTDIAEMRPGTVSVMPGGLDEQLTEQELADLVAFLKASQR